MKVTHKDCIYLSGGPKLPSKIAFLEETIGSRLALENGRKQFCGHANGFQGHL